MDRFDALRLLKKGDGAHAASDVDVLVAFDGPATPTHFVETDVPALLKSLRDLKTV